MTNPPTLQYGEPVAARPWRTPVYVLAGGTAQFALLIVLSFHREAKLVDQVARVLEFPLFRVAWGLHIPVPNSAVYLLGLLNGMCWAVLGFGVVWCVRRMRPDR